LACSFSATAAMVSPPAGPVTLASVFLASFGCVWRYVRQETLADWRLATTPSATDGAISESAGCKDGIQSDDSAGLLWDHDPDAAPFLWSDMYDTAWQTRLPPFPHSEPPALMAASHELPHEATQTQYHVDQYFMFMVAADLLILICAALWGRGRSRRRAATVEHAVEPEKEQEESQQDEATSISTCAPTVEEQTSDAAKELDHEAEILHQATPLRSSSQRKSLDGDTAKRSVTSPAVVRRDSEDLAQLLKQRRSTCHEYQSAPDSSAADAHSPAKASEGVEEAARAECEAPNTPPSHGAQEPACNDQRRVPVRRDKDDLKQLMSRMRDRCHVVEGKQEFIATDAKASLSSP